MPDLITIGQLSALIEDQYRLLGWLEDNAATLPTFDAVFAERNQAAVSIGGEEWSVQVTRTGWEWCHRGAGRLVELSREHPSPFDFHPATLLRYVHSIDDDSRITDIVIDNWILKFVCAGRLATSRHRPGYYTFR